jgi:DNA-binding transcriptional regulator LsrR (DeoR family)
MSRKNELRLITQVARMYYLEGSTQAEIARRLALSQASVSRMIKQSHDENIVRITITPPLGTYPELEARVRSTYGIGEVVIAHSEEDREAQILEVIGEAAAYYLETTMNDGEVIGISSWSQTIFRMVNNIHPIKRIAASKVVQILGGIGNPRVQVHATQLTTRLAQLVRAEPILLSAPGVVSSREAKLILAGDPYVRMAGDEFRNITLAIIGVGAVEPSEMLAKSGNVFASLELENVKSMGAVGDISLRFFDADGTPIRAPLDERVIGISLDELKAVPRVVALAGGGRKVAAIRGMLRGGYADVLITDQFTAEKLV